MLGPSSHHLAAQASAQTLASPADAWLYATRPLEISPVFKQNAHETLCRRGEITRAAMP